MLLNRMIPESLDNETPQEIRVLVWMWFISQMFMFSKHRNGEIFKAV